MRISSKRGRLEVIGYEIQILIFLILFPILLFAQINLQPSFRNYSMDDGLPSNNFHSFAQDSKGYIWLGSVRGVTRFDGYEFKNFGLAEGLRANFINYLKEDGEGRMWMGSLGGGLFYHENDSIYPFEHNDIFSLYRDQYDHQERFTFQTSDSTWYIQLTSLGVLMIDQHGNHQLYPLINRNNSFLVELEDDYIYSTHRDSNFNFVRKNEERFVKSRKNKQSYPIDWYHNNQLTVLDSLPISSKKTRFPKFHKITDSTYLISNKSDIWIIENKKLIFSKSYPFVPDLVNGEQKSFYLSLLPRMGVHQYNSIEDFKQNQFRHFLPNTSINRLGKDTWGGLWLLGNDDGIYYTADDNMTVFNIDAGLPDNYISTFAAKNDSILYVGFGTSEIIALNILTNTFESIAAAEKEDTYFDLTYHPESETLFGKPGIAFYKDRVWSKISLYKGSESIRENVYVNQILKSKDHKTIYLGTKWGVYQIDAFSKGFIRTTNDTRSQSNRTYSIFETQQNTLLIGKSDGLWEWAGDTLISHREKYPSFKRTIFGIQELSDSTLVFGVFGVGLVLWKDNSFIQIQEKDGLSSNFVQDVFVDKKDVIWVATYQGLNKITQQGTDFNIQVITKRNGLPSNQIHQIGAIGDKIVVGTNKGLVLLPETTTRKDSEPPLLSYVSNDQQKIDYTTTNRFDHTENNLSIEYVTINYKMDGKIPYRYRLNEQEDWIHTQTRQVQLYNLAPDEYQFEVQSQNEDGYWSASTLYAFSISSPFWETAWFRILLVIGSIGIFYWFYQTRVNRLKQKIALEAEMNKLKQSAQRAQMNPHFIFNSLNSIQNFIVLNNVESATNYLGQFAKLMRGVLDASLEQKISIRKEMDILESYLNLEQARFPNGFEYYIHLDAAIDPDTCYIPSMLIQPFLENAIIHGIADKEEKGIINLHLQKRHNQLHISVEDNGKGFTQNSQSKYNATHKSVGISNTKRRLELLNQKGIDQNVVIKEITNKRGEILGTRVQIWIKMDDV